MDKKVEKKKLSKKKIVINTLIICITMTLLMIVVVIMQNSFNINNESLSLSNNTNTTNDTGPHIRYITEDTIDSLSDDSVWKYDDEKKKMLEKTFDENLDNLKEYQVDKSKTLENKTN